MNESATNEALDAIHDIATKLLLADDPDEISEGLDLIVSIARYKHDVRSDEEKARYSSDDDSE